MWLLKLSSKSPKPCLAKTCGCWSLPRVRHSTCPRNGWSMGLGAHTDCEGQSSRIDKLEVVRIVRSACKHVVVVVRWLWLPHSPPPASPGCRKLGKALRFPRNLIADLGRGNGLRRTRSVSSWREGAVSFVPLLLLCSAPGTHLCRSAPGWGVRGCWVPLRSPCWREGSRERILPAHLLQGKKPSPEQGPSREGQYSGPASGQAGAIWEKKGGSFVFFIFSLYLGAASVSSACPVAAHSGLCCQSVGAEASIGVSGPRLGDNYEQVLLSKGSHEMGRGLCEGFIPPWGHRTSRRRYWKIVESPLLSYRKVKYLGAYSSRIKTTARCRLL